MRLRLIRMANMDFGVYGKLLVPDCDTQFTTAECPDHGNLPGVSCIPEGLYELRLGTFHHGTVDTADDYPCIDILGVPGRKDCKIHIANSPAQLKGCVGVGKGYGTLDGLWSVTESADAFHSLMAVVGPVVNSELSVEWGW